MDYVERAADWSGIDLDDQMRSRLIRFKDWLADEGIRGGGLGPNEVERLEDRHLADSVLFAGGWPHEGPPARWVDVGSGVGLPGLVLAIIWPGTAGMLVDRSGKRCDLARRAVRILEIDNVEVVQGDADRVKLSDVDLVVSRATADAERVREWCGGWLTPRGVLVVGGSHVQAPLDRDGTVLEVPTAVLDRPVWIRIMASA